MARTITINGTDRTSVIRLADFSFTESANRGEVGISGLALDDAASLAYYDAVVTTGASSYWRLSETTSTFADSIGAVTGTAVGGMTRGVTGALDPTDTNAAVNLNGSTGYVDCGDNYDFAGVVPFSIACWVKLDTIATIERMVSKYFGSGWSLLYRNTSGKFEFTRNNAITASGPNTPAVGIWYHVVGVHSDPNMTVYVDGVAGTPSSTSETLANLTHAVRFSSSNAGGQMLDGTLDEVAIWSRALSGDEVALLYGSRFGGAISVPALKATTVDESAASTARLFTGYTHDRVSQKGPFNVTGQRQWDVELADLNTLADDFVLSGAGADRNEETDYARVTWLLTTVFNTTGGVSAGVVPNSNTVTMDAVDYRGRSPRDVLNECAEAAGKNWFIYYYSSGPLLYYDLATGTSLSSTARISDLETDVDNSVTWAPIGKVSVKRSPDRIYSTVRFKYKRGTVTVTNAATVTTYRTREKSILDLSVKTAAKATAKANKFLDGAAAEIIEVSQLALRLPAANVNDIRAGHRVQLKLTRHGIYAFTYYRVLRRTVVPLAGEGGVSDVEYLVNLSLAENVLSSANGSRGGDDIWEEKSNADDDGASVIIDRGGITVTDGAITVTNGSGTVIIDGTSEIFLIAASGTLVVPINTQKGDVLKAVEVNTGLTYEPHTVWSIQLSDSASGVSWTQPLPEVFHNLSGQIINYYTGMARKSSVSKTTVRGLKGTTNPPLAARTYKYWIFSKQAF